MIVIAIAIACGYMLGLSLIGYVSILWLLRRAERAKKLKPVVASMLTFVHFGIGIAGMVIVPAFFYGKFKGAIDNEAGVAFAVTLILVFGLAYKVVRELNFISENVGLSGTDPD